MKQRGRPSASALQVAAPVETIPRPDAPYDLDDEQSAEWWAIVNVMPADHFPRSTHGMLADYCRHVVRSREIDGMTRALREELNRGDVDGEKSEAVRILSAMKAFDLLFKMAERESRSASSLATRMRLTQQATIRADAARQPAQTKKPWER